MNIESRIKERREELGLTLKDVADALNIAESTASRYETGKIGKMGIDKLEPLAKVLKVTPEYLLTGKRSYNYSDLLNRYDFLEVRTSRIPILGNVSCGQLKFAEEDYIDAVESNLNADFALYAKGESMIGDDIKDGDLVFVRRQSDVNYNDIAVVLIEDEATLKHVQVYDDVLHLVSSNPKFPPIIVNLSDNKTVLILGKAIGIYRSI